MMASLPSPVDQLPARSPSRARSRIAQPLDDVSKKIIEQLQEDGRRPYASIAQPSDCPKRLCGNGCSELVRTGVVQIVAVTNPLHLGFTRQAMIGIKVDGRLDPVVDAISALEEVAYVVVTAGSFDVLAEVDLRGRRAPAADS